MGFLVIVALSWLLLPAQVSEAKSYAIGRVRVKASLLENGTLSVEEERSFGFDGDFTYAYRQINCTCRGQLSGIQVEDETTVYQQSESKEPNTYRVYHHGDGTRIEWYFQASNTSRTFRLRYSLADAVKMHRDGVELEWQPIGSEWGVGSRDVSIQLDLPEPPIDVWFTGSGFSLDIKGTSLNMYKSWMVPSESLTVRLLLPKTAVSNHGLKPSNQTVEGIRKRAGRIKDPTSTLIQGIWLVLVTPYMIWFGLRSLSRPHHSKDQAGQPDPLPPAVVARFTGRDSLIGLQATVLDLLNRGVLTLTETPEGDWRLRRNSEADLTDHEQLAMNLLFLSRQDTILVTEWKTRSAKDPLGFASKVTSWWNRVARSIPQEWVLPHRWDAYLVAASVVPLLSLTPLTPLSILAGLAGGTLVLFGLFQRRKTDEGYRQETAWVHERWRLVSGDIDARNVPIAVALGIDLRRIAVPEEEVVRSLSFLRHAQPYFAGVFAYAHGGIGAGAGGGGGCGGGGGAG